MALMLIDTNLLIYAHDQNEPVRQTAALSLLRELELRHIGVLSVQNLAEFFNVATRRLSPPLSAIEATTQLDRLVHSYPVFDLTLLIIQEATRGAREYQFSYYDAQLWASARLNQIPIILSEDFNAGSSIEGIRFVNPFAPDFQLDDWIQ